MTIMTPSSFVKFQSWADDLNRSLPILSVPVPSRDTDQWRQWVNNLIDMNRNINIPTPNLVNYPQTEHWRDWARQFIQSMQFNGLE